MGLIKEPLNVDFVVDPRPLTEKEREMINDLIKTDKLKNKSLTELQKDKREGHEQK